MSCLPSLIAALSITAHGPGGGLRPPAVPLVVCDPYFSIWSRADKLTEVPTTHWTGSVHRLTCLVRVDGETYRLLGDEPSGVHPLDQTSLTVTPTRTVATFAGPVEIALTFMTPALPEDLDVYSRPVTYVIWTAASRDGKEHEVSVYLAASPEIAVDQPDQEVEWDRPKAKGLTCLRTGTVDQPQLVRKGDNCRIDWGHLYAAAPKAPGVRAAVAQASACEKAFIGDGTLPKEDELSTPKAAKVAPVLAHVIGLGKVGAKPTSRHMMLAYDPVAAICYFSKSLPPYWRRNGMDAAKLLEVSEKEFSSLAERCAAFDAELCADLEKAGGPKYAQLGALAYRQCTGGNGLVADANGQPLLFPKENTSNGCVGTMDVIYPMAPQFLLLSPSLAKAMLAPLMDYAASNRWPWPFAPHDLGVYPRATGQVYGGGEQTEENQMPVEETGNAIILLAALAKFEGNADFAGRYWPLVQRWAEFLKAKGYDPENQLCTDDFAGHLAHNVNLSAKAIVALGAYAQLCAARGEKDQAETYRNLAKSYAEQWMQQADDGDHYRLSFDRPGSWSQKYNLVWDHILGLDLFPEEVKAKEMRFYRRNLNPYGLPLDSRKVYTKADWILWTATLGDERDFRALLTPVWQYLNDTTDREPMSDWYWTHTGLEAGMHARPVVGGVFLRMLYDADVVRKWTSRDRTRAKGWAPFPCPAEVEHVMRSSQCEGHAWRYTTEQPPSDWTSTKYDDTRWGVGHGGFGREETPGTSVRTKWETPDIWIRRTFPLPECDHKRLQLWIHHDEGAEVYINGVLAARVSGYLSSYEALPITEAARATLRTGANFMAVHCRQTAGGQYIDVGMVEVKE